MNQGRILGEGAGVEVELETSAPPPKENPGSAPVNVFVFSNPHELAKEG